VNPKQNHPSAAHQFLKLAAPFFWSYGSASDCYEMPIIIIFTAAHTIVGHAPRI